MILETVQLGPLENNTYFIADESAKESMVVDPTMQSAQWVLERLKKHGLTLRLILNTHGHYDHIADNAKIKEATGAKIFVHELDKEKLLSPASPALGGAFPQFASTPDRLLKDGDTLTLGTLSFQVIHTPGHSPGAICLFEPTQKLLFSGDTLFAGNMGRTDFEDGSEQDMAKSLKRLLELPDDTQVLTGHGNGRLLKEEKPWMREYVGAFKKT